MVLSVVRAETATADELWYQMLTYHVRPLKDRSLKDSVYSVSVPSTPLALSLGTTAASARIHAGSILTDVFSSQATSAALQ